MALFLDTFNLVGLKQLFGANTTPTVRDLIRRESVIGAQLFGPVPAGHRREFFCLDQSTWIWYEEWTTVDGQPHSVTTRYEVHPNGVMKAQDGQPYTYLQGNEARNFHKATRAYRNAVLSQIYQAA